MRLGIISDAHHYLNQQNKLCTLIPLARQFEQWAKLFEEVTICAPFLEGLPPPTHGQYLVSNIRLLPIARAGGNTIGAKLDLAFKIPGWWSAVRRLLQEVDAVHIRCPNNVSVPGLLMLGQYDCFRQAIYTGNWNGYATEPVTYRWQRWFLRNCFRGPVAVYGQWPDQPSHIVPSFSPSFSDSEWKQAVAGVEEKIRLLSTIERLPPPIQLVTVGHLSPNKNHRTILLALSRLKEMGVTCKLHCLGDGNERRNLESLAKQLNITESVMFHGYVPHQRVVDFFRQAHFSILASKTEGFPKVLGEAMLYGAVPLASDVGLNKQILGHGSRGLVFPYNDAASLAELIDQLANQPQRVVNMIQEGRRYTKTITLEGFREHIRSMLEQHWRIQL